jgi:electron transport complex protein RnfD
MAAAAELLYVPTRRHFIGGAYLVVRKVISPIIPLCFIGTVVIFSTLLGGDPLYQMMSGGLLLGAIFMATDYTTSPITRNGKIIFGVGCGIITVLIRFFAALPEGVSYAILLMNILVPHIENLTIPKVFGEEAKVK